MAIASRIEKIIRFILICYCSYHAVRSLNIVVFSHFLEKHIVDSTIALVITVVISVIIGAFIQLELMDIIGQIALDEDEEEEMSRIEHWETEFIYGVGTCFLYFCVQLGIMIQFFPDFSAQRLIGGIALYPFIFLANSLIVYCIYRLTILKW